MPYVDTGKPQQLIGVCLRCNFEWVVANGTRGKLYSNKSGRKCPFCGADSIRYKSELNK